MDEIPFIKQNPVAEFGEDFLELKKRGIEHIQNLSGEIWTDYNHHDPGITILEQLCYALTEISYQENLTISNLLTNWDESEPDYEHLGLSLANKAFSNHALKPVDYSRIFYDRIDGVINSWLVPVKEDSGIKGRYHLYLNILDKEEYWTDSVQDRIKREAIEIFNSERNLGEDLMAVTILAYKDVDVRAKIIVETAREPSEILAEIVLKVEECLTPRMHFMTLDEMEQKGYSPHEIFEGPRLINGIIPVSAYQAKPEIIDPNSVTEFITRVPDVDSVRLLNLIDTSGAKSRIKINKDEVLRYKFEIDSINECFELIQKGSGRTLTIDRELFLRHYRSLRTALRRVIPVSTSSLKPNLIKNRISKPSDYYSIQNDFPAIYGINKYGVPTHESDLRKAQANQLKGYLYLFEQILADGMALPHSLKSLFSLSDSESSYPFVFLDESNIPGITQLYNGFSNDKRDAFESKLKSLQRKHDNSVDRKSRAIDYLISLYGESCSLYSMSQFNYYYTEKEFKDEILKLKIRFLRQLADFNHNRSAAFDYLSVTEDEASDSKDNVSGLEMKARILLGITRKDYNIRERSCRSGFEKHNLKLKSTSRIDDTDCYSDSKTGQGSIEINYNDRSVELNFSSVDFLEGMSLSKRERKQLLAETRIMKEGIIDDELLKSGISLKNYVVGQISSEGVFQVLLRSKYKTKNVLRKLGNVKSAKEACDLVIAYLQLFRELSIQSEDLILLEHILLRSVSDERLNHDELLVEYNPPHPQEQYKRAQKRRSETYKPPETTPEFYSHKISIFLPDWTRRFSDPGYQSLVSETINLLIPAHLVCNLYWLTPEEMCDFENKYNSWISQKSILNGDAYLLDELSDELIRFILKLDDQEEKSDRQ